MKVGAHSGVSRSRVAIGKEVLALKKTVAEQNAQIQKLTTLLNGVAGTKMKADPNIVPQISLQTIGHMKL